VAHRDLGGMSGGVEEELEVTLRQA
jgi:hypothetical protein